MNFGLSRFHHVDIFIEQFLQLDKNIVEQTKKSILDAYSKHCRDLYLKADLTPDVIDFINELKGTKFVASGSEQEELRDVFKLRGLDTYFDGIYGSPIKKSDLIANILELVKSNNAIMFGDAILTLKLLKLTILILLVICHTQM